MLGLGSILGGGLGLVSGVMGAGQQRRAQQAGMEANAEAMRYSPWTGMKPQMMQAQPINGLGEGIGGLAQGAMFGKQFDPKAAIPAKDNFDKQLASYNPSEAERVQFEAGYKPAAPAANAANAGGSYLGGKQMSSSLGNMFNGTSAWPGMSSKRPTLFASR